MKHSDIKKGMVLRLKPNRQKDYALMENEVVVYGFQYRKGYKVPFVFGQNKQSGFGYYKPSDFSGYEPGIRIDVEQSCLEILMAQNP